MLKIVTTAALLAVCVPLAAPAFAQGGGGAGLPTSVLDDLREQAAQQAARPDLYAEPQEHAARRTHPARHMHPHPSHARRHSSAPR